MSAPAAAVYVISGASRGIGFALTSLLAQRDDVLIFAGARDPANALPLQELARKTGKVIPVKLEAVNEADAAALVQLVEEKAGKVDVLINNAGIAEDSRMTGRRFPGRTSAHPSESFLCRSC